MAIDDEALTASGVVKDENDAHPVPDSWRSVLADIVSALARGDFALAKPLTNVNPVQDRIAEQMRAYILDYGATLIDLPSATWESSCAQWMGKYWIVLVDLWTLEEGRSDLVLEVKVVEHGNEYRFTVELVYVP